MKEGGSLDFNIGDKVWIQEKKEEKRQGKVLKTYPCFILVWVYGRASKDTGWRECFLWHDVEKGIVIRQGKGQKANVFSLPYPVQSADTVEDEKRVSVHG